MVSRRKASASMATQYMRCAVFPPYRSIYDENFLVILAMTDSNVRDHTVIRGATFVAIASSNLLCKATTLMMNPKLNTNTTTGSTLNPGLSSVYNLNMVPEDPPAPAARVEVGLAFFCASL